MLQTSTRRFNCFVLRVARRPYRFPFTRRAPASGVRAIVIQQKIERPMIRRLLQAHRIWMNRCIVFICSKMNSDGAEMLLLDAEKLDICAVPLPQCAMASAEWQKFTVVDAEGDARVAVKSGLDLQILRRRSADGQNTSEDCWEVERRASLSREGVEKMYSVDIDNMYSRLYRQFLKLLYANRDAVILTIDDRTVYSLSMSSMQMENYLDREDTFRRPLLPYKIEWCVLLQNSLQLQE